MNSVNDIWNSILSVLKDTLSPTTMSTWFSDCVPVDLEDNNFVICTTTDFKRSMIKNRYSSAILSVLNDLFSAEFQLVILVGQDELEAYRDDQPKQDNFPISQDYTFENFIVGPSNKFAHAAALAVAEQPGTNYNPLVIYGNSGLGKSHLLGAIGHSIYKENPNVNMVYIKGDDFTNEMVSDIRKGKMVEFRQKYREADLFLMDDIQFIAGKQQTQEEFFHTFNALYEAGKQIVVTSDRPPSEMSKLEDRILTRLEGGLLADVQPPDLETRMAIVRDSAAKLGMILPDEIVTYISERITSNIRQLKGVVIKLTAFQNIMGDDISLTIVKRVIGEVESSGSFAPTADIIIAETARYYGLDTDALCGLSHHKSIVFARQVAMYLCRTLTSLSLKDIGKSFNRDHTTVLTSIRKIEDMMKAGPEMNSTIRDITSNINAKD